MSGDMTAARTPTGSIAPGGTFRFAVTAADGRRSVDWRVWTAPNSDDVYVAARQAGGEVKVSLHQSASWQHGFTSDEKARGHRPPGASRHFAVWPRPSHLAPGWTRAMRIVIPVSELQRRPSTAAPGKPVFEIPAPPPSQAVVAEVWLEEPGAQPLRLDQSHAVGCLMQCGGGRVWVVVHALTLPGDPRQRFTAYIEEARERAVRLKGWSGQEPMTICLHDPSVPNGELVYYEVAVPAPVGRRPGPPAGN